MSLRILITNAWLSTRSGSELYVSDLAQAFLARGHTPIVYSPILGRHADTLRARTIPVVDNLADLTVVPDIIHGHHNRQIMTALLQFPGVPAVRVCHGWLDERPQQFPRILRFIAVDDTVKDRLVCEWGIPEARVEVVLNFVDLSKFQQRAQLPVRPARALVFSNAANNHLRTIRRVCEARGISVDAVGSGMGRAADAPESILQHYDVVFAKARSALEAMAVGTAVVLCDEAGMGPLVTSANFDRLRRLNFGLRALGDRVTDERLAAALEQYDCADARAVCLAVRATAGLDAVADTFLHVYQEVIDEWGMSSRGAVEEEFRAAAAYLRTLEPEQTLRGQTLGFIRALYGRAERIAGLRAVLPTRAFARRLAAGFRRG